MSKQPSIVYDACVRFDALKAIKISRYDEKQRLRAAAAERGLTLPAVAFSTGRIHADKTLETYKGIALRYVQWARAENGIRRLTDLDAQAEQLVARYLRSRCDEGDSAHTLKTIRSALRMFHRPAYQEKEREERVRVLGADVLLPVRHRADITRSRQPVAMDREIALERYTEIVAFCAATGVRRRELEALLVQDIGADAHGCLLVEVYNGKGGKYRTVPVLSGHEDAVLDVVLGRPPEERVFPRVPVRLDVHSYRRAYAQALYCDNGRRPLPSPDGRLVSGSIDPQRALVVAHALGHNRIDIVLRHYLR